MCGFTGICYADHENNIDSNLLKGMCDVIAHRGPDDEGYLFINTFSGEVQSAGGPETQAGLSFPPANTIDEDLFDLAFGSRRL